MVLKKKLNLTHSLNFFPVQSKDPTYSAMVLIEVLLLFVIQFAFLQLFHLKCTVNDKYGFILFRLNIL